MSLRPDQISQLATENAEQAILEHARSLYLWETVDPSLGRISEDDLFPLREEMRRIAENVARGRAS